MSIKACLPFLILLSLLVSVVEADVIEVEIIPENPVQGDVVNIFIKAEPDEELSVKISHSIEVNVSDGKYEYGIDGITMPSSVNSITGKVFNVKNLHLSVKMQIWITISVEAVNGVATISQNNIKEGTYDIRISGDALEDASRVTLKMNASTMIVTDQEGHYEYTLSTESLPPGTFTAQVGEITKDITLLPHQVEPEPQESDLQLRVSLLEEEIATLKTEKSALEKEKNDLEEEIVNLESYTSTLEGEVDALNGQIYDLDKSRSLWQIISAAIFITGIIVGISVNYILRRR
jgi:hypothetical protein